MVETDAMPAARFADRQLEVEDLRIRYREAGQGDAVVCIHGAYGMRVSRMHELLAAGYRVIVFELPGFGESPPDPAATSMRLLAASMNRALGALGLGKYSLIGAGIGAKVALWMALEQADRVRALVLLGPVAVVADASSVPITPAPAIDLLYAHPERQAPAPTQSDAVRARQEALLARMKALMRDPDLPSRLRELTVPSLALFGTKDRIAAPDDARLYRDLMPKCNLIFVYDAAHALDADRPEAVAEVVADFLKRQDQFLVAAESALIHP
jgi:pimeloyl-ACP methyl ester carboxylesterase